MGSLVFVPDLNVKVMLLKEGVLLGAVNPKNPKKMRKRNHGGKEDKDKDSGKKGGEEKTPEGPEAGKEKGDGGAGAGEA